MLWPLVQGQLNSIESTQQELAKLETEILDDLEALREESDSTRDMLQTLLPPCWHSIKLSTA